MGTSSDCPKCGKAAELTCVNCRLVKYCSRECQKADWKTHKTRCLPYEIKRDEKKGRYLCASRDIAADTVVVSEFPGVVGPKWNVEEDEDPSSVTFFCVGCFEPIGVLCHKCPKCLWPACSPGCIGMTNPDLHEIECAFLKLGNGPKDKTDIRSIKEYFRQDALLALKILILQRKNPKKFKALMDLEANEKNRLLTYNFKEAERKINYLEDNFLKNLKKCEEKSGQVILPLNDKKILHKIFGIIETNAMYINLPTGNEISALFPTAGLFEHSCLPNCRYRYDMKDGFKISFVAARDIKTGEHLTSTSTNILWSTQMRNQHLKDVKYFTCSCPRCKDPSELGTHFSTLRCIGTDEGPCNGLQLPVDPSSLETEWVCNKCPVRITNENVSFIVNRMNEDIEGTLASTPNPKAIEDVIDKLAQFLHPTHYHMFTLKHALVQLYGSHQDMPLANLPDEILKKKLSWCNELLQIVRTLDPYSIRIPIYTGVLLFEKFNALREKHNRSANEALMVEAKASLEEAQKILKYERDSLQGRQLNKKIDDALLFS